MIDLDVRELGMAFGRSQVLDEVSFRIDEPQVCGLIGPNGAGKTTLANLLDGVHRPTAGAILVNGIRVDGLPPHRIARYGIGRTFQIPRAFGRMSVLDNVRVPALAAGGCSRREARRRAGEALELLGLDHLAREDARALSGGQRKLLELARLVMLDPQLLVLDEPLAGVHPSLRARIYDFIAQRRAAGKAFLVIEHDMDAIFRLSERLLVLAAGRLIADGPPDAVKSDPAVIDAYLGRPGEDAEAGRA